MGATVAESAAAQDNGNAAAAAEVASHEVAVSERKPYYDDRIKRFEEFYKRELDRIAAAKEAGVPISIVLPDGSKKQGIKNATTPIDVANEISKSLAKKCLVAKVDGQGWDLFRPLEGDCALQLLSFDDEDGKETFWHSSSHLLGQVLELEFGVDLTIGPALEEGFYYDCHMGPRTLGDGDRDRIRKRYDEALKSGHPFQRVVVSRDEALSMFQENKFKIELITSFPEDAVITVYRVGPMVDLCSGPHLPNSGLIKAFSVMSMSRAHWRGDVKREPLQRVYGITFPDTKQLKEWEHRMEEAKKRDHRLVGVHQELFMFHPWSPGSCFFLPHGARVYNTLTAFIRDKYWEFEYDEVVTPNIFNFELWKTSGHADHYRENMFSFEVEKAEFGLKPMNCPGHCLMFANRVRSYRELPWRLADFGVLHRNEFSGALQGLTRVRRFQQDDAHIFCRPDQVMQEVTGFLKMLGEVYDVFGLDYSMVLSTRPEGYLGELELWNRAEAALTDALNASGRPWAENPGDGAFYGPKIDITVYDALRRKFQCATVQLDFQLPIRFDLKYTTEDGFDRPVIVHRAILGSVERMFAILTEHFAGKWPLWLSPRQVMVVPISEGSYEYACDVRAALRKHKFFCDADLADKKMQKKVREAQLAQYNYILVVGESEKASRTVNVRTRDNVVHGAFKLDDVVAVLAAERDSKSQASQFKSGASAAPAADAAT